MNWKAVGLGSGKTYATGTHADCIMAISDGEHVEAIRVMREGEHILSNEEELEVIEEKMRQVKEKKHIQLEIKKAALAEIREQKRIAAEQEEIRIENIRLESIARQQAAKEAAKLTSKPKKEKPERVMPIAKMPAPRKRLKRDAWSSAEKMDTAQIIKPDDMPDESDISAVKIGKVVPYDSVKVDFKDMPPIEISDGCSNEPDMIQKPPHHNKRRKGRKYKWSVVTQSLKTGNVTVNVFDSKEAAETYHERQKPDTRQWVKRAMHHYDRG